MSETVGYLVVLCSSCGHAEHYGFCGEGADSTPGPCKCAHYKEPLKPGITFTYCPSCIALRASEAALAEKLAEAQNYVPLFALDRLRRLEAAVQELIEAVTENTGSPDRVMLAVEQGRRALADEEGK